MNISNSTQLKKSKNIIELQYFDGPLNFSDIFKILRLQMGWLDSILILPIQ